jgi:hypothetical protein
MFNAEEDRTPKLDEGTKADDWTEDARRAEFGCHLRDFNKEKVELAWIRSKVSHTQKDFNETKHKVIKHCLLPRHPPSTHFPPTHRVKSSQSRLQLGG